MIYEEYEAIWSKIRKLEKELFESINKRDELFDKTQPKSPKFDKEMVDGKNPSNMMEQFVMQQEYYDLKIKQLNQSLDDRYQILNRKREELKRSKNVYDKIYYLRYVERLGVYKISVLVGYSKEQTYRYLRKIKMTQNDTKDMVL